MAFRDEQADILGGPILQRPESGLFSRYPFVLKSVAVLGFGLFVLWIVCSRGLEHLKKHRELRYRKAMRRKHGIPDSDCRPFAVAYAAAKRAHLEREAQDRKKTTNRVSVHNLPAVDQRTDPQKDARGLRRRVPETTVQLHDYQLIGKHVPYDTKHPDGHSLDFVGRYNPNSRRPVTVPERLPVDGPSPVCRMSRKDLIIVNNGESRKRSFEDESDVEHETIKKSRIDDSELIEGDEQADWFAQYADPQPRKASKVSLCRPHTNNYVSMDAQKMSERVSDFRDQDHRHADEEMEGVDGDEVAELKAVVRGKKRDRAEAGSTFEGDDDDDIRNGRISHHRKRRTISQRGVEVSARGQKRDREAESPESEGEGGESETSPRGSQRSSKKKRGKKSPSDEVSEISVEDARVSKDPLCSGPRVDDEWETDGVQYKVGDKGERLRLTLVKKARNKYHMPQDSQHPDRSAALEIYVETWMTDEQYKQAEGRQELAWQEAPVESSGSKTPNVLDSSTKNGKNLLWDSVKGNPTRRPFRQFMPATGTTRINPFEHWQLQPALGRRVASSSTIVSPMLPGVADSPTRPGLRGFSKWEKQDREAEALARIRAKIEEHKKSQVHSQNSTEIPPSASAPELGTKPLSVPTITLTPAPVVAAEGNSNNGIPQIKPSTSTSFSPSASASDSIKSTPVATSMPAAAPSTVFLGSLTAPTMTPSTVSLSPFSFTKTPHLPLPTSTTSSSSVMPGKGTGIGVPSLSTLSPSTLGTAPRSLHPSTESATKLVASPFAKQDVAFSSPAVVAPPTTKSPASNLGTASNYSPVNFGSSPGAAPVSTSVAAPESSKPTVPIFSFPGASSSTSTFQIPSALSAPKFSFGQPSTTSTFIPGSNLVSEAPPQPKLTFKFGQTPPLSTDGDSASKVATADEWKKSSVPVSASGSATGSNESVKPSPFVTTSTFGNTAPSPPSALAANPFGKAVTVDGTSMLISPKPALPSTNNAVSNNTFSSAPAGTTTPGNPPVFSFGGTNTGSKPSEETKTGSLFAGATGNSNTMPFFGGNSTEKKTFTFSPEGTNGGAVGLKPPVFRSSAEGPKPLFTFGGLAETSKPPSVPSNTVEGSKSAFVFSGGAENKPTSGLATDVFRPPSAPGTIPPNPSAASTFMFGKKEDATINVSTSVGTQSKPSGSFGFGASSGEIGLIFGQASTSVTSANSTPSTFGKPMNTTPGTFGSGGSSASSAFTFGKPPAQSQKQEQ